jgi:hypothetical protein
MIGETVTFIEPGTTTDGYGATVPDWINTTLHAVEHCAVAPRSAEEDRDNGRQAVVIGLTIYAPAGTRVEPTWRATARDGTYEVDGEPGVWVHPWSTLEHGVEIQLRRVQG